MQFRAELHPNPLPVRIRHSENLMLIGSCFTEQIGSKLETLKFTILQNPHGILFNPASISKALCRYAEPVPYSDDDLFFHNDLWVSWDHHSRFSGTDREEVIVNINTALANASRFLAKADWLVITLGSAFVYERTAKEGREIVSNCHKVPPDKFNRRLLEIEEVVSYLRRAINAVKKIRPYLNVLLTISPVRHLREGFVDNNRSKAVLINAVHQLTGDDVFYFPSYELIIDDLRDYRFFAEDLVHPNYAATNYVWEKFLQSAIDPGATELLKEIGVINNAFNHKPFNPTSSQHKKFMGQNLHKCQLLVEKYPYLDLEEEIKKFSGWGSR